MPLTAQVHLQTAQDNGITILKNSYCTRPFKIADVTEDKSAGQLRLMLMSSSPGILDEDAYHLSIEVAAGGSMHLETQSYQRLFAMKKGATQHMEVHLAAGSSFHYIPLPVVPHKAADFSASNTIHTTAGCVLCLGEVLTCGRKLSGEVFQYTRYHNITRVFAGKKLVYKENLLLQPQANALQGMGMMEGYTHQASLIYMDACMDVKYVIAQLTHGLMQQTGMVSGITAAPFNGIMVRLLGNKAEQLHQCLVNVAAEVAHLKTGSSKRTPFLSPIDTIV